MLIPFDGTFESHRDPVPILVQKNSNQHDWTDAIQNWRNGQTSFFSWMGKTTLPSWSHSLKKGIPPLKNLFTSFFQMMSIPVLRPQTTSSLMFRDFLLGLGAFEKACAKAQ